MHAFLITGGTTEERLLQIAAMIKQDQISQFDIRPLTRTEDTVSIGIAAVRHWQKQLHIMPSSSRLAAGVIQSADLLTVEAQNALLKTLEEPPIHTHIYMEAQSINTLLPTILSRCTVIAIHTAKNKLTEKEQSVLALWKRVLTENLSAGNILMMLDAACKNKNDAQQWVDCSIAALSKTKNDWPVTTTYLTMEKQLLDAKKQLEHNVSYKLVLDRIFLSFVTGQS